MKMISSALYISHMRKWNIVFQSRVIIINIENSFTTTQYYFATWKSEDQKKIAKNSLSGFLNRIYKAYNGGILITEAAFLINQYCISEQSISSLSQLEKKKSFSFFLTTQWIN